MSRFEDGGGTDLETLEVSFFKTWTIVQHRIGVIQQFVTQSAGIGGKAMGSP